MQSCLIPCSLALSLTVLVHGACLLVAESSEAPKPTAHTVHTLEGWTVRVDERLLTPPNDILGARALRFLEHKLSDIKAVVAAEPLAKLQAVTIVLDLTHGQLRVMQYHPNADWLRDHGYETNLVKCVHIPEAADLVTARNVTEQPWVVLHELAHAYHDQVLGFEEPRILRAYDDFKRSGRGEATLLYDGTRVRHYGLVDPKEFFAEMTESYFGLDDFYPFNRAELLTAEPEIFELIQTIWGPVAGAKMKSAKAEDRDPHLDRGREAVATLVAADSIQQLRLEPVVVEPEANPLANPVKAPPALGDKTLVVWVAPANLTQHGGSVLTLDDGESHFDGIVFGEIAPARWMAGSDFYRRTHREQQDWPEESVGDNAFVQIAITYRGREVTVYRNGQPYAQYSMASAPQPFGPRSVVVIGPRHLDQGDNAHFAGVIDDARIYEGALSAQQIAALKANEPSDLKPWAWWIFDDANAEDRVGRFRAVRLLGGAKVEDGTLVLNGKTATLLAATTTEALPARARTTLPSLSSEDFRAARRVREHLLADPHRPGYHFVIPEGQAMPFDPNGAIYWKGQYHLFYIFQDERGHNWGHISSIDLFHWRHHLTGLVTGMFSGNCFLNKEGRPTMCYHQVDQGNAMAVALDDQLNRWKKLESNPITPKTKPGDPHHDQYRSWDPYGWLEGDTYYAIFGGTRPAIVKALNLEGEWKYVGDLMANSVPGVSLNEDVSCADFFRLGDRHMLLCIGHQLGCRYYLGEWKDEQFHPTFHEKMSWVDNSFFAPESLLDDRGRRIMWAWIFDAPGFKMRTDYGWSGTLSLPRVLALGKDGRLRMNPPEEIERLRYHARKGRNLTVNADSEMTLAGLQGNSLELKLEMKAPTATQFGVKVCCSPGGEEQTRVYYDAADKQLKVDTSQSSLTEGPRSTEAGPFELQIDEPLMLRVFVDKSVVEVFANGRQAVMRRIYPSRADSVGVRLFSVAGPVSIPTIEAWDLMPSNAH